MSSAYITTFLPFLMHLPYIVGFPFRLLPLSKNESLSKYIFFFKKRKFPFAFCSLIRTFVSQYENLQQQSAPLLWS